MGAFATPLGPILTYIKIGFFAIVGLILAFLVWKWFDMQATIKKDQIAISELTTQVKQDRADISDIKTNYTDYSAVLQKSQDELTALQNKINKYNWSQSALTNPTQTETEMNFTFNNLWQCLSVSTGAKDAKCEKDTPTITNGTNGTVSSSVPNSTRPHL